jgi:hypothetical protein
MKKENNNGLAWMIAALGAIFALMYLADLKIAKEYKNHQPQTHCTSRVSGGRPSCWTDADWEDFCSRTTICK